MSTVDNQAGKAIHYAWSSQPSEKILGSATRRFITSKNVMIGEVYFKKGDLVPPHIHHHEQFTHVISGAMKFRVGAAQDQEILVSAGEVIHIPPNLLHSAEIMEDTLEYDIFNPPRQDWIDQEKLPGSEQSA